MLGLLVRASLWEDRVSLLSLSLVSPKAAAEPESGYRPCPHSPTPPGPSMSFERVATLTDSSSTLPKGGRGRLLAALLSALPCLSRLWSVPMTGWPWCPKGTQPRACGCTWRRAEEGQLGLPPWPPPWEPQEMYPHQTRHPAQGLVSTAQQSDSGRVPKHSRTPAFYSVPFSPIRVTTSVTLVYCS